MTDQLSKERKYTLPVVIEYSKLEGKIAIIADEADAKMFPDCTVYLPLKIAYLLKWDDVNAIKFHKIKRLFGGFLEKPSAGD